MNLHNFLMSVDRGYLPEQDPIRELPRKFAPLQQIFNEIPKLLMTNQTRRVLRQIPPLSYESLSGPELERAMLGLSYIGHAYVWGDPIIDDVLPKEIAVPWYWVATKLGRLPVLSYASYALYNWKRIDPKGPIACGNIALLQNFWGGADEEWFILIHVDIEAKASAGLNALIEIQKGAAASDPVTIEKNLDILSNTLQGMLASLNRMPEFCDPYIYYNRVRPYIHGWRNNPSLPNGLLYEGVDAYQGKPVQFRGETGAQSSIIPAIDGLLRVYHKEDRFKEYLLEMRDYMPPKHKAFIEHIEKGPDLRAFVLAHADQTIKDRYNACVELVEKFRSKHLEYANQYIFLQHQKSLSNPTSYGTGGTPFIPYLTKHRDETSEHIIK